MYCKKCGNYMPTGINKCAHCGWVIGEEIKIEEEKKEEEITPLRISDESKRNIIIDLLGLVFILSIISFFMFINFIGKDDNYLSKAIFYNVKGFDSDLDGIKGFMVFANMNATKELSFFYTYKFILYISSMVLLVIFIMLFILNIKKSKKEEYKSKFSLLFFIYGLVFASSISSANIHFYALIGVLSVLVILSIIKSYFAYKEEMIYSNSLVFISISFILMIALIFLFNMSSFVIKLDEVEYYSNIYDYIYHMNNYSINGAKTVPEFNVIALDLFILSIFLLPTILLKYKDNKKMSILPIFSIFFMVLIIGLSIYNIIALKEFDTIKVQYLPIFFVFAAIGILINVFSMINNKINVNNYKSTKLYSL